jgi:hypothetical protein
MAIAVTFTSGVRSGKVIVYTSNNQGHHLWLRTIALQSQCANQWDFFFFFADSKTCLYIEGKFPMSPQALNCVWEVKCVRVCVCVHDALSKGGAYLRVSANPLLYKIMWQSSAKVSCPNEGFETVYDEWLNASMVDYGGEPRPQISSLGSGSDFTTFLQQQGISSVDFRYVCIHVSSLDPRPSAG